MHVSRIALELIGDITPPFQRVRQKKMGGLRFSQARIAS
jgi:hypothetical protein